MRTFHEIACEICKEWAKVSPSALPYLAVMFEIFSSDKNAAYGYDSADSIVRYFLANAGSWRGDAARRIKAELKAMIA